MKLLFENWRKYLNEAELKYSEAAWKMIWGDVMEAYRDKKNLNRWVEIPAQEVFYLNNKKIKNGAVILWLAHFGGQPLAGMKFVQKGWDPETGMREQALQQFLKEPLKIFLKVDKEWRSLGSMGIRTLTDGNPAIVMILNPWKHLSVDQLKSTIRHELQHVTQTLNGYALHYGESLFNAGGNASKIEKLDLRKFEKEFGTGKQKTGLRQISRDQAREQGIGDAERIKRYLGDDFEYETWMSDMLDDLVRWIYNNEFIKKLDLQIAAFKELNPNILSEEENNMEARKNIINLAKQIGMQPIDVVKMYKKAPSIHQLAVRFAKEILTNDQALLKFAKDSKMDGYTKAVKTLLKLRPKEFAGDFTKNLALRLRKEAGLQ